MAASIGGPEDFPGLSALIVAGAAIGRSASLLIKPGYFASASLYGINVGNATSGKTPALTCIAGPLTEINANFLETYLQENEEFQQAHDAWERAPKSNKPPRPIHPRLQTIVLNDCTAEIVKARLAENPRGLINVYDEGSAWIGSLNQYKSGKGTDRQFYLSALNGSPIRVDRMKDRDQPTSIRHPFLSIVGNMTPETLGDLREGEGRSDGFVERILFAFPEPTPRAQWSEEGVSPEAEDSWRLVIQRLRERPLVARDDKEFPHVVYFSPAAKRLWVDWFNANVAESRQPGYETSELSVDGKLENFTARLALILHLLMLATDPQSSSTGPIPELSMEALAGAIVLWRYFRSHHRRARWRMNGGIENRDARSVVDWIKRHGVKSFTRSEITSDLRWLNQRAGGADEVLDWLGERHILRKCQAPAREPGKRGQTPSPSYDVNPCILAPRNTENTENSDQSSAECNREGNSSYSSYSSEAGRGKTQTDEEVTWTV